MRSARASGGPRRTRRTPLRATTGKRDQSHRPATSSPPACADPWRHPRDRRRCTSRRSRSSGDRARRRGPPRARRHRTSPPCEERRRPPARSASPRSGRRRDTCARAPGPHGSSASAAPGRPCNSRCRPGPFRRRGCRPPSWEERPGAPPERRVGFRRGRRRSDPCRTRRASPASRESKNPQRRPPLRGRDPIDTP